MFTYETMELFRITRLSELGMSHIADNVVLLQHVQDGSQMKRALTVLKSRGSDELDRHPRVQDLGRRHHPRRANQPRGVRPLSLSARRTLTEIGHRARSAAGASRRRPEAGRTPCLGAACRRARLWRCRG